MEEIKLLQTFLKRARPITPPDKVRDLISIFLKQASTKKGVLPSRPQEHFLIINIPYGSVSQNKPIWGQVGLMFVADEKSTDADLADWGSITNIFRLLSAVTKSSIYDGDKSLYKNGMYSIVKGGQFYSINSIFDFLDWEDFTEPDDMSIGITIHTLISKLHGNPLSEYILNFDELEQFEALEYLVCMFKTMDSLGGDRLLIYNSVDEWIKKVISIRKISWRENSEKNKDSGEECFKRVVSRTGNGYPLDIDGNIVRKLLIMEIEPSTLKIDFDKYKNSTPCYTHNRLVCENCGQYEVPLMTGEPSSQGRTKVKKLFLNIKNPIIRFWDPFVDFKIVGRWIPNYEHVDVYTGNYHLFRRIKD